MSRELLFASGQWWDNCLFTDSLSMISMTVTADSCIRNIDLATGAWLDNEKQY